MKVDTKSAVIGAIAAVLVLKFGAGLPVIGGIVAKVKA